MGCRTDVVLEGTKATLISLHVFIRATEWPVHWQWALIFWNTSFFGKQQVSGHACACSVVWSHLTVCDPMDCSPPSSSVHGSLQARTLEWVLPDPRIKTLSPATPTRQGRFFTTALPGKPHRRPKILCKPCEQICWHLGFVVGEGNGTPLQYSCLENPMDRGA